jgi:hypothetical protein
MVADSEVIRLSYPQTRCASVLPRNLDHFG